jgi:hypothetical protein
MKLIYTIALVFLLFCVSANGQALNLAFLNSTVFISYKPDPTHISSGSGFLVFREVKDGSGQVFLVTNKHVLPHEGKKMSISIRVLTKVGDKSEVKVLDVPIIGDDGKFLATIVENSNKEVDVAAVNITEEIVKNNVQAEPIPYALFVTKDKIKSENINVGDEIFLLGYPSAIFDPRNISPILRVGIISTTPLDGFAFNDKLKNDYGLPDKIDGFLIDANVFPGSSGSLVILKPQASTIGPQGETVIGSKKIPYLLGIVSMSIPIDDIALSSRQRMGLGVVYSADTIKETIEQFYKSLIAVLTRMRL